MFKLDYKSKSYKPYKHGKVYYDNDDYYDRSYLRSYNNRAHVPSSTGQARRAARSPAAPVCPCQRAFALCACACLERKWAGRCVQRSSRTAVRLLRVVCCLASGHAVCAACTQARIEPPPLPDGYDVCAYDEANCTIPESCAPFSQ